MFSSLPAPTHNQASTAAKAALSGHRERTFSTRIGVLAAAALVAASLSVALPLQVNALPSLGGHGVSVNNGPVQPNVSAVTYVVTKGQKG